MKSVLIAALFLLGSACVSVPARELSDLGVELPTGWKGTTEATGALEEGWLESFSDARLNDLVREALAGNRDVRALAARVEAAGAQVRIAGADRLPQVGASLNGSRQRQNFIGFPIPGSTGGVLSSTSSRTSVGVDVSWEADLWGRVRAGRMAAVADYQATEADLRGARLSLAARVAKAWFGAIAARKQVELSRETVESYRGSNEAVQRRYEAGLRPSLDLRLLRSQLADAEARMASQELQLDQTLRQLEILLGRYPGGVIEPTFELSPVPPPAPSGLPVELLARRPDLVAAERRLAAADARLVQARASLYPSLRLTGSGGTASTELGDLLDGDFRVWSLAAGLVQPLFQGGRLRATVQLADARVSEALESFAASLLGACAEVETGLAAEGILARRESLLSDSLDESSKARELAESQYRSGLSDVLTLLEARRRALTAEIQLIAVRRQRLDTRVELLLALGGGFGDPEEETGGELNDEAELEANPT